MSDTLTGLGEVLSGDQWAAAQYVPDHAVASTFADEGDDGPGPKKKKPATTTVPATDRILTGDEWATAQRKSADELKRWQIPAVPKMARDVTRTPLDVAQEPRGQPIATPIIGPIMRQVVDPALEHPLEAAAVTGAMTVPGLNLAVGGFLGGQALTDIARYGYQKYLARGLSPDARAEFEADPERVTGEAAAVQAAMLGLAPLLHVGVKGAGRLRSSLDYGAGMTEAGAKGVGELNLGPRFSDGFSDRVANEQFARDLAQGAQTRIPNDVPRPAGFVASREAQPPARNPRPVEGLVVEPTAKAGKVTPIATEGAAAPLEERAAIDQSVRDYQAERARQDAADLADQRRAEAERVAAIVGGRRRRPGGVQADEPAHVFQTEQGAEMLGATAAQHGLPNEASPYVPDSPNDVAWKAGHQAATESPAPLPSYPEGFSIGALDESRIPPASEVPKPARGTDARPAGFEPTALPEGVTPESAALAASLKPSRFRKHSLEQLDQALLDAQTRLETAQRDELFHSEGQLGTADHQARVDNNQEAEVFYAKSRAKETAAAASQLAQIEREYALRGVTGGHLAERVQAAQETRAERQAMQEEASLAYTMGKEPPGFDPFDPFGEAAPESSGTAAGTVAQPVEGTGPVRTRGLASAIERKAIANKLATSLPDLPEYRQVSMADQADRAAQLLADDPARARRVALGEEAAPKDLLPEAVLVAVERQAVAEGDVATLRDLATGQLGEQVTHMGQRIRALAERDPDSPVGAIQQVVDARTAAGNKVPRATEAVVADIKAKLSAFMQPEELAKFLDSLRC